MDPLKRDIPKLREITEQLIKTLNEYVDLIVEEADGVEIEELYYKLKELISSAYREKGKFEMYEVDIKRYAKVIEKISNKINQEAIGKKIKDIEKGLSECEQYCDMDKPTHMRKQLGEIKAMLLLGPTSDTKTIEKTQEAAYRDIKTIILYIRFVV